MIFRYQQLNPPAIIYFREKGTNPLFAGQALLALLQAAELNSADSFIVIEKNSIRQRAYTK